MAFTESFTKYNNLRWIRTDGIKEDNGYIKAYGIEILLFSETSVKMNGEGIITNEPVARGFIPGWAKVVSRDPENYVNFQVGDILTNNESFPGIKARVEARSGNIISFVNLNTGHYMFTVTTLEAYSNGWRVEITPYERELQVKEEEEKIHEDEPVLYKLTDDSEWRAGRFDRYAGRRCFYVREPEGVATKMAVKCIKLTPERINLIGCKQNDNDSKEDLLARGYEEDDFKM